MRSDNTDGTPEYVATVPGCWIIVTTILYVRWISLTGPWSPCHEFARTEVRDELHFVALDGWMLQAQVRPYVVVANDHVEHDDVVRHLDSQSVRRAFHCAALPPFPLPSIP